MFPLNNDGGLNLVHLPPNGQKIDPVEAMRLLAGESYGRVVFTADALPAIRPVNHLVDGAQIIIRTRLSSALSRSVRRNRDQVVAYEADRFDDELRQGWSVVVLGRARVLGDDEASRYEQLLTPWVNHADDVVSIAVEVVNGLRITTNAD